MQNPDHGSSSPGSRMDKASQTTKPDLETTIPLRVASAEEEAAKQKLLHAFLVGDRLNKSSREPLSATGPAQDSELENHVSVVSKSLEKLLDVEATPSSLKCGYHPAQFRTQPFCHFARNVN
jgi:hypothetical protein